MASTPDLQTRLCYVYSTPDRSQEYLAKKIDTYKKCLFSYIIVRLELLYAALFAFARQIFYVWFWFEMFVYKFFYNDC